MKSGYMETIGADVEVFAVDKDGKHISMCGKIGGTKEKPKQVKDFPKGYMVQEDNVSLEYNVPPSDNKDSFRKSITVMREYISSIIFGKMGLSISDKCAVSFDEDQLQHPHARVFGCEPDYNAWTKRENTKPECPNKQLRSAGGHIHVGTGTVDMLTGIKAMDLFLGVPSIIYDDTPSSKERRALYGKSGAMRPKPYGFEYRVLSNFWMFNDDLIDYIFHNTSMAMKQANSLKFSSETEQRIQDCINSSNKEEAIKLMNEFAVPTLEEVVKRYKQQEKASSLYWRSSPNFTSQQLNALLAGNSAIIPDFENPPVSSIEPTSQQG